MFRPASSTTPVTAAADQIEGCAPAPAAHAVTSNTVASVVRILGIGFYLSCQTLAASRERDRGLATGPAPVQADGQRGGYSAHFGLRTWVRISTLRRKRL